MWVDKNNYIYEFILVNDLYEEDDEGNSILIKKDMSLKHTCCVRDIDSVTQMFNEKGRIKKDRCKITIRDGSIYTVKGSYDTIKDVVFPKKNHTATTGFKTHE